MNFENNQDKLQKLISIKSITNTELDPENEQDQEIDLLNLQIVILKRKITMKRNKEILTERLARRNNTSLNEVNQ
jgi:hypothetical protein